MTEKNPAEKSGFDFFAGFVLAEELGDSARHQCAKFYNLLSLKTRRVKIFHAFFFFFRQDLPQMTDIVFIILGNSDRMKVKMIIKQVG
ncbi:hypothetical protein [Bacillus sp. UMB0893]|uniref:hypothetical protein n=1 Tax=Bacillus sp. UMB0893 TaxID=2066053 RepID=UPI000C77697F|nr:hypothetical protein [Bacillus sp. UMB0893]PLR66147.1 hypothetical protein CYJ36_18710 [Bacillus sp. UMB0893]